MGSQIQTPRPGEMNIIRFAVCFSLLASYGLSQRPTDEYGSYTGKPTKPGDGDYMDKPDKPGYEDWMEDRCCPLKAVESASDESKNEMYALVEQVPWSQVEMENCTSNCAYVKMNDLKMVMEEMNMTDMNMDKSTAAPTKVEESEGDMVMMNMLFGPEKMMKMKMKMKINRLQKYCFAPTDNNIQSMCASMDMNAMEILGLLGSPQSSCPTFNVDCLNDNSIGPPTKLRDFNQCGRNCRSNEACEFWTMIPLSSTDPDPEPLSNCWLLFNCNKPKTVIGDISGTRDCPPGENME